MHGYSALEYLTVAAAAILALDSILLAILILCKTPTLNLLTFILFTIVSPTIFAIPLITSRILAFGRAFVSWGNSYCTYTRSKFFFPPGAEGGRPPTVIPGFSLWNDLKDQDLWQPLAEV